MLDLGDGAPFVRGKKITSFSKKENPASAGPMAKELLAALKKLA